MAQSSNSSVSVLSCSGYDLDAVRRAVEAVLQPLGGIGRFLKPGMQVLLKPNLLNDAPLERAVTTHPALVRAVAGLVQEAGGRVWIGDSPGGPIERNAHVFSTSGMAEAAEVLGAELVCFDGVTWKRLNGTDYYIARQVFEADLVIDLPKLKTHGLTLYTGAVKNLFGVIPGRRKRELHFRAPGVTDFSTILVDVLELAPPGLTIMDGVVGLEGNGPGAGGTPHRYGVLAASADPVALDAVLAQAMGYRAGQVVHLAQAAERGLGVADLGAIDVIGERSALDFGRRLLPRTHWYLDVPSWISDPLRRTIKLRPELDPALCIGCGRCAEVCPGDAITPGKPPVFDFTRCVGCLCCAEICPKGALDLHQSWLARLLGVGQ
ncbi:MAG: DUF362 domain-containing protein [Anaerolineae bacterium]|nr:DUF362 domain-containing protein [Anaerolineae bacterium]